MRWWMRTTALILLQLAAAGVNLERLLWVRCCEQISAFKRAAAPIFQKPGPPARAGFAFSYALEQVLKVTDLLLQGGGFGMVVLDMGDIPAEVCGVSRLLPGSASGVS